MPTLNAGPLGADADAAAVVELVFALAPVVLEEVELFELELPHAASAAAVIKMQTSTASRFILISLLVPSQ